MSTETNESSTEPGPATPYHPSAVHYWDYLLELAEVGVRAKFLIETCHKRIDGSEPTTNEIRASIEYLEFSTKDIKARYGKCDRPVNTPDDLLTVTGMAQFMLEPIATMQDPRERARLAKAAGMRYVVLTSKHHEGFCLFDSKLTDFKATNTPARRDLVRMLLDAFRAEGSKVGLYYSLIDWHHPGYPVKGDRIHPMRNNAEYCAQARDLDAYVEYLHGQVRELLTDYGPIDIMWFDFSYGEMAGEKWRAGELLEMARTLQPGIIINDRLESGGNRQDPNAPGPRQPGGVSGDGGALSRVAEAWRVPLAPGP